MNQEPGLTELAAVKRENDSLRKENEALKAKLAGLGVRAGDTGAEKAPARLAQNVAELKAKRGIK